MGLAATEEAIATRRGAQLAARRAKQSLCYKGAVDYIDSAWRNEAIYTSHRNDVANGLDD